MRSLTAVAFLLLVFAAGARPAAARPAAASTATYRILPGDTLWSLSRRFATTPDRLAALNSISSEATLQIGRTLRVPTAPALTAAAASIARTPATTVYSVQAGDTLWRISRRYNTTPERLAALNAISEEAVLRIGMPLRVPVSPVPVRPPIALTAPVIPVAQTATDPVPAAPGVEAVNPTLPGVEPEPAAQPPVSEPPAPAPGPARNPSATDPGRPRISRLPSRGAQWMTTIVALSRRYLGAPYRWGGESPNGFDCSGFLNYIFEQTGIDLPRTTFAMFAVGTPVPNDRLQAGDVVFFQTVSAGPSHAGVYLGDGRFIHVSSGQRRVTITAMAEPYYTARYLGARRY